jgi:hypothetical protein
MLILSSIVLRWEEAHPARPFTTLAVGGGIHLEHLTAPGAAFVTDRWCAASPARCAGYERLEESKENSPIPEFGQIPT